MESNVQKMMVIIDEIKTIAQLALNVQSLGNDNSGQLWDIIGKCNSGLSIPIRNCEVGTEELKQDKEPSSRCRDGEGDSVNPECLKKDNVDIVPQIGSVGNAAAMREALKSCLDFIMRIDRAFNPFMQNLLEDAISKAKAALSASPRNCDRFNNEREMQFAFLAELLSMGRNGASLEEYSKWLLAESKGASDEGK